MLVTRTRADSYNGAVHYDALNGVAGTNFPVGTPEMPCSSEADVKTICLATNIRKISVYGLFTVPSIMEGYEFIGHGQYSALDTIDFSGQDVDGSVFRKLNITGAQGGTSHIVCEDCHLVDPTNIMGTFFRCLIQTATFRDGVTDLVQCSGWQGTATINVGTPAPFNAYQWSGNMNLGNQVGGTSNIYVDSGEVQLLASCTGGTINIHGNARVIDASAGSTVNNYSVTTFVTDTAPGRFQISAGLFDLNSIAATWNIFVTTDQPFQLETFMIRLSGGAPGGALTAISVETDDATPSVLIDNVQGAVGNLTNEATLAWTGSIYLDTGKHITLTIYGGAAVAACVTDVVAGGRAIISGGYLAPVYPV